MTQNIYVASSWRNPYQADVVDTLRDAGHTVYDFKNPQANNHGFHWSEIDGGWQSWTPTRYRAALEHPIAVQGFRSDWDAMEWADTGVLVLPSGRSAHLEAGYFVGARKPLYILLPESLTPPHGSVVTIPLTQGFETTVDAQDGELAAHKWHVHPSQQTYYAARSVGPARHQRTIFLHRAVMDAPDGVEVDHVDGNGLNNQRSNLRLATRAQNGQNNHNTTGLVPYRGVFVDKAQPGRWRAAIRHLGQRTYIGSFDSAEDAARAYDAMAIQLHGQFARTNFREPQTDFTPELMYRMATRLCLSLEELVGQITAVEVPL